jgi:hypothetical protein
VRCTHAARGCKWEGTIATLEEHVLTCTYKDKETLTDSKSLCYVFVEDSNLWVAGQKAQGQRLKDADHDSRFRVDLGRFLTLVTKGRIISKSFLYGSTPPLNDSVWKAAEEKRFVVQKYSRSGSGKAKEVHAAMVCDIMETPNDTNTVCIIVTGDRNLKPVIDNKLENGVHIELWSWNNALATEFRQLANTNSELFEANLLDNFTKKFGYTAYMSRHTKNETDPAHAIVYRGVPDDDSFKFTLANHLHHRLMKLFYVTAVESLTPNKRDYIIEFPKSAPEEILRELRHEHGDFEYQPCSYPQYIGEMKEYHQPIITTNRFDILNSDSDYESLPDYDATEGDLLAQHYEEDDTSEGFADFTTEVRRRPVKIAAKKKIRQTRCMKGDHCPQASLCPYQHTEEEELLFEKLPNIKFQYFRTKECNKKGDHNTAEKRKYCAFAHDNKDSWCLSCKEYGHLTNDCRVKK